MFYDIHPRANINLEKMEMLALERLRVLRLVEKISSEFSGKVWLPEYETKLKSEAKSQHLYDFLDVFDFNTKKDRSEILKNRAKDHFSHFILRLAYCRTDELRRWFVAHEAELMRFKLSIASKQEISNFMKINDLRYVDVDEDEMSRLSSQLSAVTFGSESSSFYKVHFTEALDLVRSRRVYLENGIAYVPDSEMKTLLTSHFKNLLSRNLALTTKTLPNLEEDDRLVKMLAEMDKRYTGDDYSANNNTDVVTAEMVRPLSAKSFPMCMKSQQMSMDKDHHLKYKGRLQYGLFLKGIGLSMEEAIRYFRGEFTQSHVSSEKFDKEYVYGIRYNYGKEGKKVNWTPWSCMRIITENVGPGESHGCPYRHSDSDSLRSLLAKSGIEGEDLEEILKTAKEGHYQKACSMQFKVAHKGQEISTTMTEHPNQYYLESVKGGVASSTPKLNIKTEKVSLYVDNKK